MEHKKSKLEKQFEETAQKALKEIKAEIAEARKHIDKAVELSEQYGVPFRSGTTPLPMGYMPQSFEEKWSELREEIEEKDEDMTEHMWEVCGFGGLEYGGSGWEHSAVC